LGAPRHLVNLESSVADITSTEGHSVQVKGTNPRRVAFEPASGEFVVLGQTSEGILHGFARHWNDLTTDMQGALVDQGVVDRRGRPLG